MGRKNLGELYESLFSLGMTIVLVDLKYEGQYSRFIHTLAICMTFSKHLSLAINDLRCLQVVWSGPGADEAKHLANISLNSCLEKGGHSIKFAWGSSLRKIVLMGLFSAELYDEWRACYSSGRVLQGQFSYEIDLMVSRDFFLTQFIRSQGLLFEEAISNIFLWKNFLLAVWIFDLNSFQCWILPKAQYLFRLVV